MEACGEELKNRTKIGYATGSTGAQVQLRSKPAMKLLPYQERTGVLTTVINYKLCGCAVLIRPTTAANEAREFLIVGESSCIQGNAD